VEKQQYNKRSELPVQAPVRNIVTSFIKQRRMSGIVWMFRRSIRIFHAVLGSMGFQSDSGGIRIVEIVTQGRRPVDVSSSSPSAPNGLIRCAHLPATQSMMGSMSAITAEQAQNYLDRWKLVHEAEVRGLRNSPLDVKARQLSVLMASRDLFAKDHDRQREVDAVRERWARIRGALRG
jgi:hypothetical protein